MWLSVVTYLHHHADDQKLPWYRGKVRELFWLLEADVDSLCWHLHLSSEEITVVTRPEGEESQCY